MEGDNGNSFPIGKTAQEKGFLYVPECYKVSLLRQSSLNPKIASVPIVDLAGIKDPDQWTKVVESIGKACRQTGFFQIINHGIEQSVLDGALATALEFFNLPMEEKVRFMSNDVHKPVRYGTSLKDGVDKIQFWRVFLKHYAHPLNEWVEQWPVNPPDYREKMGEYAVKVQALAMDLMGAISESLGIGQSYLGDKMEDGVQVMAINCYPPCPQPTLALGLPPHSDYSCLTIVLHSSQGLETLDTSDDTWRMVPELHGALQVHIGDHVEVLSNGLYKSVVHRVTLNNERTRISIASLHSLGMDEKMGTAEELIDEDHPRGYQESSFRDFLNFLSENDITEGKISFIQSLRINK